jgi:hypothetical protein
MHAFSFKWGTTFLVDGKQLTPEWIAAEPSLFTESLDWIKGHWPGSAEHIFFMWLGTSKETAKMFGPNYRKDTQGVTSRWLSLLKEGEPPFPLLAEVILGAKGWNPDIQSAYTFKSGFHVIFKKPI